MSDLISLVSIFVLGVIGWITYKVYIWPIYITPLRKIPGPPSESLFYGNYKTFMNEEVNVALFISVSIFISYNSYITIFYFVYIIYRSHNLN
jgi:hypothetical protein